jgi:hypothetical protein
MLDESTGVLAQERVELTLPAGSDLMALARYTAATVATRAGFDIEEIEDLRLAVDELCITLGPLPGEAAIHLEYGRVDDLVTVVATAVVPEGLEAVDAGDLGASELAEQLLDALVDSHGVDVQEGRPCAWMRRRGTSPAASPS